MAKANTQLTKRSVNKTEVCQGWDKVIGRCGTEAPYSITYGMSEVDVFHTWHFCKRHYNRQMRKKYGTCSYRERREDGTLDNCTSLRDSNIRGEGRRKRGYCRRHEDQYLKDAGAASVQKTLDRLGGIITADSSGGCWNTPARNGGDGRSQIGFGGRKWTTYRFTYAAFFGTHEKGMELSHTCDNSLCCNPLHVIPMRKKKHDVLTHSKETANIWRIAQEGREAPAALIEFAGTHGLPLYGSVTLLANALMGTELLLADERVAALA